jgi:hypothetical protein
MVDIPSAPARAPDLTAVELDGENVVPAARTGSLHRLDATATAVWSRLDGRATVAAIVDALAAGFGAPREVIAADVDRLLAELGAQGLLEGVDPDPAWLVAIGEPGTAAAPGTDG